MGEWQFHLGDDPRWAAPGYDDSEWERIKADKTWGAQTHPSYTGFAWYPAVTLDIQPLAASKRENSQSLMPPVEDAYDIFWNGARIRATRANPPPHCGLVSRAAPVIRSARR